MDVGFNHTGLALAKVTTDVIGFELVETHCVHSNEYMVGKLKKNGGDVGDSEANIIRAGHMFDCIRKFIDGRKISLLVAEVPTGGAQSAAALKAMALANGVLGVIVKMMEGCPFYPVSPIKTKKMLGGSADASKKKVATVINAFFDTYNFPKKQKDAEHIYDAVGALIVAKHSTHYEQLVQRLKGEERGGTL